MVDRRLVAEAGQESIMSACALKALRAAEADGRGEDMVPQMLDFFKARMDG